MISDETRARNETPEEAVERRLAELLAEAPPLTPEQITAAVAILAQPKAAKPATPVRRPRRRRATEQADASASREAA